jgi:hypothetical protein
MNVISFYLRDRTPLYLSSSKNTRHTREQTAFRYREEGNPLI